ncbi:MAG TPA: septation protein SepH, partial [Ornithinibacter sp.]|nr:septation protein SepH [Ornithinibacter sp.]
MQDLRLIGVHEDGQHLLLANADGGRFRLPLDEALRA